MKDIRCLFGCHIYSQSEAKVVDEREGYLLARVNMFCTRCGKSYEDMIAIPFPEWLQRKSAPPQRMEGRWIFETLDGVPGYRPTVMFCSKCGRVSIADYSYCPNCGARMEAERHDR